ncbi:MAG: hypothetical protein ABIH03_01975 [Pseudomonadota bacterium]
MSKNINISWQQAFSKRFANPRFRGTEWESLYAALSAASATPARRAKPFWLGVELTRPGGLGYAGVLCADTTGEVLCTSELQRRTSPLREMRTRWPGSQLRFLSDLADLRAAARRSEVFGAVVDAASPAALSLAKSLAKTIALGNTRTALRVLSVIAAPSRRGASPVGRLPPTPAAFDVLLRSRTTKPWLEHRDLAVMCAVQKTGLIGIDFTHVLGIFKESEYTGGQWVSRRLGLAGAKACGVARGPGRAERAAKKALHEIAASVPLSQITGGIIDIAGDARLAEIKVTMETIRAACPQEAELVLGCDVRGRGPFLRINIIAAAGGPEGDRGLASGVIETSSRARR